MKSQNIDSICDSFLFISPQFNSTKNSKTIFHQNSIQKIIQNYLFPTNSIQNSIQNFEIGWIQFNKIFIQFENVGIDQGYVQHNNGAELPFMWRRQKTGWHHKTVGQRLAGVGNSNYLRFDVVPAVV